MNRNAFGHETSSDLVFVHIGGQIHMHIEVLLEFIEVCLWSKFKVMVS